jgi:hypothetical protein
MFHVKHRRKLLVSNILDTLFSSELLYSAKRSSLSESVRDLLCAFPSKAKAAPAYMGVRKYQSIKPNPIPEPASNMEVLN